MSEQIAIRIPSELAEALESLVSEGRYPTKAEAVRTALEAMIDSERRRRVGEQIVQGYRRVPQTDDEIDAATQAAIRSIEQEPW